LTGDVRGLSERATAAVKRAKWRFMGGDEKVAPPGLGEAALRDLVDAAFDALVITHAGKVIFANRAFVEMHGGTADEIIGYSLLDFVAPECHELVIAQMSRPTDARYEAVGLARDGGRVDVEICAQHGTFEGKPVRISAIRVITERKRAEEALRRSETRLRRLIEHIQDMIVVERRGAVLFANPAALRYLGFADAAELVGTKALALVHPGDRGSVLASWAGAHDACARSVTARVVRRDGTVGTVEIAIAPMDDAYDGAPANVVLARDISERQQIEARLIEVDLLSSIGMLAAGIAHEINNPLAYVTLNLGVIARQLAALRATVQAPRALELCGDIEELLATTQHGADRVQQIVRDVRVFARQSSDVRAPVALPQVLDATIQLALNSIRHRAELVREYEPVPIVDADEPRLGQLFLNLLINALHAFDDEPGQRAEIRVRTGTAADGAAFVEIADTGRGIPADVLGRVFEPFFTTKAPGVGTGLGLPICRSIATTLGGTIEIASTVGRGTTCRVTLPARASRVERSVAPMVAPPRAAPARRRVLIVDDEPQLLRTLGETLGQIHDVTCTASGAEAISLLLSGAFDVVLCDVMMPTTSGVDVFDTVRRERPGLERRIVFMTGGAFSPGAHDFLATVPNRKLEKPFTLDEVVRALADVV
jgi:PAS domain S-box-containing protein